ncbi:peptide ABC transporter substrate-binding protein [Candidatus Rhabdochlamydia sp. T3358]|uniref:peptide ABC transporter substrate-binding protein n=1 Tax=Candidatus Rhabdochlamydia sp. T3358 TaxID=2099795 RepID=UPI0010B6FDF4|nr:peptide ABC transporter substrate-binding protein [Candidatus Rhabdochlamydia sp. T3358]VHO02115.1 Oligopeptide-binding protein OppA precursor [Candidatus Rhabdochlamydia sp. T3358]
MKKILIFLFIIASILVSTQILFTKPQNISKTRNMIRLNIKKEPPTMDPRKGGDVCSTQMHFLFFEGLLKVYPDQSIKLAQAESYEVSEDKLTYTFFLRDTVWSNHTPVTAYDFEQSWKDVLDPKFPSMSAQLFSPIKNADAAKKGLVSLDEVGIKATDAKTLVITLEKPTPYLFKLLSFCAFSPVNIENDRENPDWAYHAGSTFLSNGPFRLEKWDHEKQIIAIRNPTYRKTEDLHPEKIIFNIVENNEITLQMFEKGLVDIIGDCLTDIPLEEIPHLEKKWTISREEAATTAFININTDQFPLNHPKIRRALGLAINREELVRYIAYQASSVATNMVPPYLKENRHRSFFTDNDGVQARIFLEDGLRELGVSKEAFDSVVLYYYSYGTSELVQTIQQQWLKTLGLLIKIECLDFRSAVEKLIQGDYFMCLTAWAAMYHDPMSVLERFRYKTYITNFSNWENPEYIKLLDRSFYEEADKRFYTLEQAEKIFLDEMPFIPLYHEDYVYIINPRLPFRVSLWGDRILLPQSLKDKN